MQEKPSRWAYITSIILVILYGIWAYYEYQQAPDKIPFEPIIACFATLSVLGGYLFWKKKSTQVQAASSELRSEKPNEDRLSESAQEAPLSEQPNVKKKASKTTINQQADKIYNIKKIDKADFS